MNYYNPQIHHRRSIRLKDYDYSQEGLYFLTLCCQDRACLFGEIVQGEMILNDAGKIAQECWLEIPHHFKNVVLHSFIVMPNHVHGIIELVEGNKDLPVGAKNLSPVQDGDQEKDYEGKNLSSVRYEDQEKDNWAKNLSPVQDGNQEKDNEGKNLSPVQDRDQDKDNEMKNLSPVQDEDQEKDNWAKNPSPLQPMQPHLPRGTSKTIGSVVRGFKIGVTKWMREYTAIHDVWQRNYYEHIIRNEQSYQKIADYIEDNPRRWYEDKLFKE